ncbi:MAG: IS1182 family transposase [Proteobacteria bacterium]|nr:IS1182 family transposase [Pseudomonadota bacterium]
MAVEFIAINRDTPYIFPPSVQDYLPDDHLARFVVDIVDQLDLRHLSAVYTGRGSKPFHPAMLVALLFYGYATGVFSSRKLEKATYDVIPFRYICANTNPDHDTIASFRKRFLKELGALFVEVLVIAEAMGLMKLGTVSVDGTKIKANASKHKALSWDYANRLEAQLKQEVEDLMRLAEAADQSSRPEEMDIPEELKRREQRLAAIASAKEKIQARAQERFEREQAEYEDKLAKRQAREKETGKKPRGKGPTPPTRGAQGKDQVNLTDEESRIMPTSGGGFEQSYNAQAGVDVDTHLIVEQHVTQHSNDKQQIAPILEAIDDLPEVLGKADRLLADTGYFSEANVDKCLQANLVPFIPDQRQQHNTPLAARYQEDPELSEHVTAVEAMRQRLQTREGKAVYAVRKSTVETVFGVIKEVLGFRQFLLRGLSSVENEWSLVCIGWNLKRMHILAG